MLSQPSTLKSISLNTSLKLLKNSKYGSGTAGRNARDKKTLRKIVDETLPHVLQV